jgi:hypothetical protein
VFDLGARVFSVQNAIADFYIERDQLAVFMTTGADRLDFAFLRFFLCGIRDVNRADLFL